MKFYILAFLTLLVFFFSCQSNNNGVEKPLNALLRPDQMPVEEFMVNIDRDTVLQTKNGALLKIPAGALSSANKTVTLEIKDAYSLSQMIQAGLTTQAGNGLLASDGMLYVGAKAGQDVTINKGISVAIPTKAKAADMQLFKGNPKADGSIDWSDPVDLPSTTRDTIPLGRQLFQSKCASCHAIGKQLPTGPDLAHFPRRIPLTYGESSREDRDGYDVSLRYWGHDFRPSYTPVEERFNGSTYVNDTLRIESWTDPYVCNLIRIFGEAVHYSDIEKDRDFLLRSIRSDGPNDSIMAVYNYIQSESDRNNLPYPPHASLMECLDSCNAYTTRKEELAGEKNRIGEKRASLINDNGPMVEELNNNTVTIPLKVPPPTPPIDFEETVAGSTFNSSYYQFSIETFGWYNIDVLIKDRNNVEESELFIRIVGEFTEKVQVYLMIPSVKVYVQGGPSTRDEYLAFQYKNGKIDLPQDTRAFIMAVTEENGSLAYVVKEFITGKQQEFDIALVRSNKEEFNRAIKIIGGDGIEIKVDDAKNVNEIRSADEQLDELDKQLNQTEQLRPKNCDCDCNYMAKDSASTPTVDTLAVERPGSIPANNNAPARKKATAQTSTAIKPD
jgi:hypothetical protein